MGAGPLPKGRKGGSREIFRNFCEKRLLFFEKVCIINLTVIKWA